jgi:hypothetical protein
VSYHSPVQIKRILEMAVSATETMNGLDVDPDIIKARLKLLREISDGLGIDVKIPSNRSIMIKRILGGIDD